jgi:hypothetical protein
LADERLSRETMIAAAIAALAVAAMAVDHLLGDDPGLEDPPAFLIASGLSLLLVALLFGILVPRTKAGPSAPERAATRALACSILAIVALPLSLWLGLPFPLAGAGVALGLVGRAGSRRRLATASAAGGLAVLALATGAYAYVAVDKLL